MPTDAPHLSASLGCDVIAAAGASLAISPIVAIVDRSVVQITASSQRQPIVPLLWKNFKPLILTPGTFLASRATRLLFLVYFGTYATANSFDSIFAAAGNHDSAKTSSYLSPSTVKLLGVSAVSTSLTVYKDSRFAQMFGASSSSPPRGGPPKATSPTKPRPVPPRSYLLFALRDVLTIYGCFILPPVMADSLTSIPPHIQSQLPLNFTTAESRARFSQLFLPVVIQFVSTPIHLLGLDIHNRQGALGLMERAARVKRDLAAAIPTRMMRILPAFGIGGVLNTELRTALMRRFRVETHSIKEGALNERLDD